MLDTTRISEYIVSLRIGKKKYIHALEFDCATTLQQIDVGKFLAKLVIKGKAFQHKKRGYYPLYSKNKNRPAKDFVWKKFPIGVATPGALM